MSSDPASQSGPSFDKPGQPQDMGYGPAEQTPPQVDNQQNYNEQGYGQPQYGQATAQPPGYGQPMPYAQQPQAGTLSPSEERTWATVAHAAAPVASLVSVGTLGWAVPLVVYLMFKERSAFVRHQSAEALNFQITLFIAYLVCIVLAVITLGIGMILFPVIWILSVVFGIIAAIAVSKGEPYRYPFNLRLVS